MTARKRKIEFEQKYLSEKVMPKKWNIQGLNDNKDLIKSEASKLYKNNHRVINKVGFSIEDIEAIYNVYTLIHLDQYDNSTLRNFLKQRGLRLVQHLESKCNGILESFLVSNYDDETFSNFTDKYSNPEEILSAKETAKNIETILSKQLKSIVKTKSCKFYKQNKAILMKNDIQSLSIDSIANDFMLDYILKTINDGSSVSVSKFKIYLSNRFSKFLYTLKDNNGI